MMPVTSRPNKQKGFLVNISSLYRLSADYRSMSGNRRLILTLLFALCVLDPACEAFTNLSVRALLYLHAPSAPDVSRNTM